MKLDTFLAGLIGLCLGLGLLILFLPQDKAEYYSLIVTDTHNQQWVVDYNLTLPDCTSMKASPAARCSLQPEGRI